jgi:hypothetical protein
MFCKNCGQPVAAQATFCGSCGQPVHQSVPSRPRLLYLVGGSVILVFFVTAAVLLILSTAWQSADPDPELTAQLSVARTTESPSQTDELELVATAINTPAPSVTPFPTVEPTLTPSLTQSVLGETIIPFSKIPISADNVTQVTELTRLGRGPIFEIAYSPDGSLLAVATSTGIYLHDNQDLAQIRFIQTDSRAFAQIRWQTLN